ncbi:MAG TPA: hypothetical protein V6D17_13395 [Candidatus Obscuribacterales bacterium]
MQLHFEGTTFAERIGMVFDHSPVTSEDAENLLDALVSWEREHGEFGTTISVLPDPEDAQRWLVSLIVSAVFTASLSRAENGFLIGELFIDEWLMRGCARSLRHSIELTIPDNATAQMRRQVISKLWSKPSADFRTFLQAALFRDLLLWIERFPGLLPRAGILTEALAA